MNVPLSMFVGKQIYRIFIVSCLLAFLPVSGLFAQNGSSYYLVVGSFNSYESALSGKVKIEAKYNRPAELLLPDSRDRSSRYRVSVYRSNNRSEVSQVSTSFKRKGMDGGWILSMARPTVPSAVMRGSGATQRLSENSAAYRNGLPTYYVITGSFQTYEQADRARLKKIEDGFDAEILFPEKEGGSYKVSVLPSSTKKMAQTYSALLKRRGTSNWIFTSENGAFAGASPAMVSRSNDAAKVISASSPEIKDLGQAIPVGNYYIIGGSFNNFEQAGDFKESMARKGINAEILWPKKDGGNYRVSVFRATSRAAASERNKQLKQNGVLKNGWILAQ
ncbi:MAG: SPOR domain-containing protein [Bacteroidia bacterium]|nr:SPOR domain-containing protein [Bacteroidia bacterium]